MKTFQDLADDVADAKSTAGEVLDAFFDPRLERAIALLGEVQHDFEEAADDPDAHLDL